MSENMSISVNGQSQVPPGFRFHPTEEELLHYYLKKKVSYEKIDLDVIRVVDLNKLEPWDIQETCRIGTTPQNDWYFFSHKDKKYPTGTRTNRATTAGFWKATGRDKLIYSNGKQIGMRKTLVFYKGRAPHGQKSDWIMHEYRLDDNTTEINVSSEMGEAVQPEGWAVCRIFKKKNLHKTLDSPLNPSSFITAETRTSQMFCSSSDGALDEILQHVGMTCKEENEANIINSGRYTVDSNGYNERFVKFPSLESPNSTSGQSQNCYQPVMLKDTEDSITNQVSCSNPNPVYSTDSRLTSWAALDRLVASHLNGQNETSRQLACLGDPALSYYTPTNHHDLQLPALRSSFSLPSSRSYHGNQDFNSEVDLWNFTARAPSDPIFHVSNPSV
ncbi:hypothetical protein K2173_025454 [Erythroxylum novogranatense]|uniref:NAC domain-containing protein n=1 Tax=Erythroxylum novogranatense TaxID=1862640 RepID=A0AAV8UH90_9ROSI|nr:hypothetical protein K2173_025454 [Erythroxylum novogranatense]